MKLIHRKKPVEPWTNTDVNNLIYWYGIYPDDYYKTMKAISHSRQTFYEGKPIYWYEFSNTGGQVTIDTFLEKFLRVPGTIYYEYGGTYQDAVKALTNAGIVDIMEGKEI